MVIWGMVDYCFSHMIGKSIFLDIKDKPSDG